MKTIYAHFPPFEVARKPEKPKLKRFWLGGWICWNWKAAKTGPTPEAAYAAWLAAQ